MMLEGVGVVERPKDEDFNNLWKRVKKSDKTLQQISKESAKFLAALKAVSVHSKQISTLLYNTPKARKAKIQETKPP